MARPRSKIFLFASISIHALGILAFSMIPKPISPNETIALDVIQLAKPSDAKTRKSPGSEKKTAPAKHPSLHQLLGYDSYLKKSQATVTKEGKAIFDAPIESDRLTDPRTYSDGFSDFLGGDESWPFYQHVFERIDQQLKFDSLLAEYNHFGVVFLEFVVDVNGELRQDSIRAAAEDAILKVHALRAMRAGLKKPFTLTKRLDSAKGPIRFQAKFEFLNESPSLNRLKQVNFTKPVLTFRRATLESSTQRSVGEQVLESAKLAAQNPFAIGESWQQYNKRKRLDAQEFDPFSNYRRDPDYDL